MLRPVPVVTLVLGAACTPGPPGEAGPPGDDGRRGPRGDAGPAGLACWDLDGDRTFDAEEDLDGDGQPTAADCRGDDGDDGRPCTVHLDGGLVVTCPDGTSVGLPSPYTDGDAVAAMGPASPDNPLHHARYTDTECLAAVTAAGYVPGPHTVDTTRTDADITSVVSTAGYVPGAHTVDTDTVRSDDDIRTVVADAGYVPGPHTVDTTRSDAEIENAISSAGYVPGPHTVDTTRTDAEIEAAVSAAGYVAGPHTVDTLSSLACSPGDVATFDGASWSCQPRFGSHFLSDSAEARQNFPGVGTIHELAVINTGDVPFGTYRVEWYVEVSDAAATDRNPRVIVERDDVDQLAFVRGKIVSNRTDSYSGFAIVQLSGPTKLDLSVRCPGGAFFTERARLTVWRVQ